jgi:hypothetical protein
MSAHLPLRQFAAVAENSLVIAVSKIILGAIFSRKSFSHKQIWNRSQVSWTHCSLLVMAPRPRR